LTVTGARAELERYAADQQLSIETVHDRESAAAALVNKNRGVAEVVVPPRSRLIGETVRPGLVVAGSDLLVLGVQRQGRDRGATDTTLKVGDTLLLEGRWSTLDDRAADADVLVVDSPELIRRQGVALGPRFKIALVVLVVMFVLLATSIVPAAMAALLAAGAMILSRVLSVEQAYRRIPWTTVLLVAEMLPMLTAIKKSGARDLVAGG
jgi:di/tricarboxylate transporter